MAINYESVKELLLDQRRWYDESLFREVTAEETSAVHEKFDGMVDRISASMARHTIDRLLMRLELQQLEDELQGE